MRSKFSVSWFAVMKTPDISRLLRSIVRRQDRRLERLADRFGLELAHRNCFGRVALQHGVHLERLDNLNPAGFAVDGINVWRRNEDGGRYFLLEPSPGQPLLLVFWQARKAKSPAG